MVLAPAQPALIELVDSEILAMPATGPLIREPGYALLDNQEIVTGQAALKQAWLYPQRSFSHYWHQLSLAPLPGSHRLARHNADLAYAQLAQLHKSLGEPAELLFALPGSVSRDQLSILLGMANALPTTTVALVDNAVAAASTLAHQGELLYVDLQLHQAVITHLRIGEKVTRLAVDTVTDAGLKGFYNTLSRQLAEAFIREYRYDPLHTAAGEQQLFEQLPRWLGQLAQQRETTITLDTARGVFSLNIALSQLETTLQSRINALHSSLAKYPASILRCVSYRVGLVPGLGEALGATLQAEDLALRGSLQSLEELRSLTNGAPGFITEISHQGQTQVPTQQSSTFTPTHLPTHVLIDGTAHSLGESLGLSLSGGEIKITDPNRAELVIHRSPDRVVVESALSSLVVQGDPASLRVGDSLAIDGYSLHLIRVLD